METIEIAFVCESGLVGSVMGANVLRKRLRREGLQVTVRTYRLKDLPLDASIVIGPEQIVCDVVRGTGHRVFFVNQLLVDAAYDELINTLRKELS